MVNELKNKPPLPSVAVDNVDNVSSIFYSSKPYKFGQIFQSRAQLQITHLLTTVCLLIVKIFRIQFQDLPHLDLKKINFLSGTKSKTFCPFLFHRRDFPLLPVS